MANSDISQRNLYERTDLLGGAEGIRRGSETGASIYSVVASVIAVGLSALAASMIDSWAQWVVLGMIVMTTIGFMIALNPERRGI